MKLNELKEETIDITIAYDDHCSVYSIDMKHLSKLLKLQSADDINDYIIDNGTAKPDLDDNCEHGDIFFDLMSKDVDEFHSQIKTNMEEKI